VPSRPVRPTTRLALRRLAQMAILVLILAIAVAMATSAQALVFNPIDRCPC
jgi:hypothetical protein